MSSQREEPPTVAARYEPLLNGVECDLCDEALVEAVNKLGDSRHYDLFVSPLVFSHLHAWLSKIQTIIGPLECCVHVDLDNSANEWYLSANGRRVGSKGVG